MTNTLSKFVCIACIFFLLGCGKHSSLTTAAPDNSLALMLTAATDSFAAASLSLTDSLGRTLLADTRLGIATAKRDFSSLKLVDASAIEPGHECYTMIQGKRKHCENTYNSRLYTFVNPQGDSLGIEVRVFPDGAAFRYRIPAVASDTIANEYTAYRIPDGMRRWIQPFALDYERMYPLATDGRDIEKKQNGHWGMPVLIEPFDSAFVLISESDIRRGHAAHSLSNKEDSTLYRVVYGPGAQVIADAEWVSPWRVAIAGDLATIVESTLITDLASPALAHDVDWIKPGAASWNYWAYNHGTRDFQIVKAYTDLAAKMEWPYTLLDWEWDAMANGGNLQDALEYAHKLGIKPLMWYNSSQTWVGDGAPTPQYRLNDRASRLAEYKWLKELGVDGLKIDFFDGDAVETMDYCLDLLEDALDNQLLITFHGATIPRGWQRTYPNMMTVEGVYGAEWYNNNGVLTDLAATHNATLPFTRNVIGPMDYTPGTFSDSQHPHITTHAHELALPFLFESPIQHMPDSPESYATLPAEVQAALSNIPTAWDDTRYLSGYPGHSAVLARRSGTTWYIAGINGTSSPLTLAMPLDRLSSDNQAIDLSKWSITLISDGPTPREFAPVCHFTPDTPAITIPAAPRGGFLAILSPDKMAQKF